MVQNVRDANIGERALDVVQNVKDANLGERAKEGSEALVRAGTAGLNASKATVTALASDVKKVATGQDPERVKAMRSQMETLTKGSLQAAKGASGAARRKAAAEVLRISSEAQESQRLQQLQDGVVAGGRISQDLGLKVCKDVQSSAAGVTTTVFQGLRPGAEQVKRALFRVVEGKNAEVEVEWDDDSNEEMDEELVAALARESFEQCQKMMADDLNEWIARENIQPPGSEEERQRIMWEWIRDFHREYDDTWFERNRPRLLSQFKPIFDPRMPVVPSEPLDLLA